MRDEEMQEMHLQDMPSHESSPGVVRPEHAAASHAGPPRADGTGADQLGPLARRALRGALRDPLCVRAPGQEVRAVLRQLCDAAHACGLPAERLLILLKEAWRDLPEARSAMRAHEETPLTRVITLCIDEYYARPR